VNEIAPSLNGTLTRRRFLVLGAASVVAVAGCSSGGSGGSTSSGATGSAVDYSSRFETFEAAVEPDGDLSMVVWPDFVTESGPEVRRLYEYQVTNGELMRYMPCFCGCGQNAGHRNNRDCYVQEVNTDGSVVFDSMAPT
jgi:nitrous oxide reductase